MEVIAMLSRADIIAMLGPVDDATVAEIIATGANSQELAQARAWCANDEPLMNMGKPLAGGRVGRLVEIICDLEADEEALVTERTK
jgi:hypothetical protein